MKNCTFYKTIWMELFCQNWDYLQFSRGFDCLVSCFVLVILFGFVLFKAKSSLCEGEHCSLLKLWGHFGCWGPWDSSLATGESFRECVAPKPPAECVCGWARLSPGTAEMAQTIFNRTNVSWSLLMEEVYLLLQCRKKLPNLARKWSFPPQEGKCLHLHR